MSFETIALSKKNVALQAVFPCSSVTTSSSSVRSLNILYNNSFLMNLALVDLHSVVSVHHMI